MTVTNIILCEGKYDRYKMWNWIVFQFLTDSSCQHDKSLSDILSPRSKVTNAMPRWQILQIAIEKAWFCQYCIELSICQIRGQIWLANVSDSNQQYFSFRMLNWQIPVVNMTNLCQMYYLQEALTNAICQRDRSHKSYILAKGKHDFVNISLICQYARFEVRFNLSNVQRIQMSVSKKPLLSIFTKLQVKGI